MAKWNKWIFGTLGWVLGGGPIGGIIGFAIGAISDDAATQYKLPKGGDPSTTVPNDFGMVLLVLCAAVMKADEKVMKSELDYVKTFFTRQFGEKATQQRMLLLREILKQEIPLASVCQQIKQHIDHPSRLQLIHLLFGVAAADGSCSDIETEVISRIAHLLNVSERDYNSIKAMFVRDVNAAYKILEVDEKVSMDEIKKAYRKMAMKYHPDKVHHLGPDYQKDAQEKFRKINEAYEEIKKQRGEK